MPETTIYKGVFIGQSEKARAIAPSIKDEGFWIPKSVFLYYANDGTGNVRFSVEGWKEKDIEAAGFEEA